MRIRSLILTALVLAVAAACLPAGAQVQPPAAVPAPDYGASLTNEQAKAVAAAALAEAQKNNWRMAVTVVGPDGVLIYLEKMDGTQNASVPLALAKARTAALYRRATKVFADQFAAGNTGFMSFPEEARPIASEGGLPILVNGKIAGAIGVSGGIGQQDTMAATAGANAVR